MTASWDWSALFAAGTPWARLLICTEPDVDGLVLRRVIAPNAPQRHEVIRVIRGKRCGSKDECLREWAAALQFPGYFGHTWDALYDCLRDLEWAPALRYGIFVTRADLLLDEDSRSFSTLAEILASTAEAWANPSTPGRPAGAVRVPFRVVFHSEREGEQLLRRRLRQAGIELSLASPP